MDKVIQPLNPIEPEEKTTNAQPLVPPPNPLPQNNSTPIAVPPAPPVPPVSNTSSVYPTPVDNRFSQTNSPSTDIGTTTNPVAKKAAFPLKKLLIPLVILLVAGGAIFFFTRKSSDTARTVVGDYTPDFNVLEPTQLPDDSYYLEGIITEKTKPIGTQSGIILQYRSKNVPKNADFTYDSSIIQIGEEKKKNGYKPPESCANLDEVPANKTSCAEVGKTSDGLPIYEWPSTAKPVLQIVSGGTFISVSMPGKDNATMSELVKIAASLKPASYDSLLDSVERK